MWKPDNVVPEHKTRARVVWGALLLAIVGYVAYQIWDLHDKIHNPSTNFSVSDDMYAFPVVNVCFSEGMGCGGNVSECIRDAYIYVARDACSDPLDVPWTKDEVSGCLVLDLSSVDLESAAECNTMSNKPSATVEVAWISSDAPDEEEGYSESVGIMLGNDESTHEYAEVPYTRVVSTSGAVPDEMYFMYSALTIGRSTRNFVGGDSTTSYPVLSSSTNVYVHQDPIEMLDVFNGGSYAIGVLHFTLTQGSYSLTELSDVDPFDILSLLGNIGGFWEILLVTWGICFVAARAESPTEQGRDFNQSIAKGKEVVSRNRRKTSTQMVTPDLEDSGEEQPYWTAAGRGGQEVLDGSILVTPPPVGAGPSMDLDASFRRPIPQDFPMRLVDNSSRSIITGDSFMTRSDEGSTRQHCQLPA